MTVSHEALEQSRHLLRRRLRESGKPGKRIHPEAMVVWTAQLDALTHPCCNGCTNIRMHNQTKDGKEIVILECQAHLSPIDLWRDRAPGEEVSCNGFIPVEEEIFSLQD